MRTIVKIDISEEMKEKYDDIIRTMKSKINMKSNYARKANDTNNNDDRNHEFNSYAGDSSSLEMMAQLRSFSSKSKVDT